MTVETFKYDNRIVRAFAIATVFWGIVGMSAGLLAATQLFFPAANLSLEFSHVRAASPFAHQRGHFCVCGQRDVHGHLLFAATVVQRRRSTATRLV